MSLRRLNILSILLAAFALFPLHLHSQTESKSNSAAAKPKGFLDYTLGKINPKGQDYGARVESMRTGIVKGTIDDVYFWSNAFTLALLVGVTTLFLLELRSAEKKEVIVATLITALWNGRVSDQTEIGRRTDQYNVLVERHNSEIERTSLRGSNTNSQESGSDARTQRKVERLIEGPKSPTVAARKNQSGDDKLRGSISETPIGYSTDLQQQNLLMQSQIEALANREQNLKERLNQTTSLLDQERKRNQTLKGA